MSIALEPVAWLMTRSLYTLLNGRHSWYERLQVSPEAAEELQFWHKCFSDFNSRNIWRSPLAVRVIYSDAIQVWRVYGGAWSLNNSWPMVLLGDATKLYMEGTKGYEYSVTVICYFPE